MKTEELVALLATGAEPVDTRGPVRRSAVAIIAAGLLATLAMAMLLGVRPTLGRDAGLPMFWMKFAFVGALAIGGLIAAWRLARPGARLGALPVVAAVPTFAIWLIAIVELARAAPAGRLALLLGQTAAVCPFRIAGLSLPVFVAALWALRGFAPTRLRLAGASAGLLAGGVGAFVYAFHCPELEAAFLGVWYVIGVLIPAAVGALVGPRVLRW
jgi:hypothetical protein